MLIARSECYPPLAPDAHATPDRHGVALVHVRRAAPGDADALAALIADYLGESYGGSGGITADRLRRDVLGDRPRHHVLLADAGGRPAGFVSWDWIYELQWGIGGARVADLYVAPAHRGVGAALALVARLAADVRAGGGTFLRGEAHPRAATRRAFGRAAVVAPSGEVRLTHRAFQRVADLAGRPTRAMVRALPPAAWNDEV